MIAKFRYSEQVLDVLSQLQDIHKNGKNHIGTVFTFRVGEQNIKSTKQLKSSVENLLDRKIIEFQGQPVETLYQPYYEGESVTYISSGLVKVLDVGALKRLINEHKKTTYDQVSGILSIAEQRVTFDTSTRQAKLLAYLFQNYGRRHKKHDTEHLIPTISMFTRSQVSSMGEMELKKERERIYQTAYAINKKVKENHSPEDLLVVSSDYVNISKNYL